MLCYFTELSVQFQETHPGGQSKRVFQGKLARPATSVVKLYSLNSRSSPLQFKHTQLSNTLPLGSFEHVFGQARFLHNTSRYYLKARLYFSSPWRESSLNGDPARWSIYVHNLSGQKLRLKVSPYDLCLALKPKIRDKWNVAVAQQRLVFRGQQLVDGSKLYDSGIFDGAVVHLVVFTRVQPPPQPLPPI